MKRVAKRNNMDPVALVWGTLISCMMAWKAAPLPLRKVYCSISTVLKALSLCCYLLSSNKVNRSWAMKPQLINDHPIHKQSCNMRLQTCWEAFWRSLKKVVKSMVRNIRRSHSVQAKSHANCLAKKWKYASTAKTMSTPKPNNPSRCPG